MAWKALDAKKATLASGRSDIQNLVHSLSEHASHTIQAVDIAMAGMVDLLKYRNPEPDRFNRYLAETAKTLPQLRAIGVANADGNWSYSSLPETPRHNVTDRSYFVHHRDTPDNALRISEPSQSRLDDQSSIVLSKRITRLDGNFGDVVVAAIDKDYFNGFYRTLHITISAGVAAKNRSTLDEAALVGEADAALYEAKRLGRNRSVVYSSRDLQYVDSASIQHDDEFAPGERTH